MQKVLTVELDSQTLQLVKNSIENVFPGIELITVTDFQKGIRKALNEIPNVIFWGTAQSNEITFNACKTLRFDKRTTHTSFIFIMKDKPTEEFMEKAYAAGCNDFLNKQSNLWEYRVKLHSALELSELKKAHRTNKGGTDIDPKSSVEVDVQTNKNQLKNDIFDRLFKQSDNIIYRYNLIPKRKIVYISEAAERITGYSLEEHYTDPDLIFKIVHPDDVSILEKMEEGKIDFNQPIRIRWRTKNGKIIWTEQQNVPVYNKNGELIAIEGVARNATTWKEYEDKLDKKNYLLNERIKELNCLFEFSRLIETPGISIEELLKSLVHIIPSAWQYPEITCSRIIYEGMEFQSARFKQTSWKQSVNVLVKGKNVGGIEVFYLEEKPHEDEGPFYKEERSLIETIANGLGQYLEREKALEKLERSEELLREMGRVAKIGGWEFDVETGDGKWTDEVARIHGLNPDDETSRDIGLSFYVGDSRKKVENAIKNAVENRKMYNLELEIKTADNKPKWVHTIGRPVIQNGKTVRVRGSFQDITEQKKVRDELLTEKILLRTIIDTMPVMITRYDPAAKIMFLNREFERRTGWKNKDLLQINLMQELFPDEAYRKNALKYMEEAKSDWREFQIKAKSGEIIYTRWSNVLLGDGTQIGIGLDITHQREAEMALKENEENLRVTMDSIGDAVIATDIHGNITRMNPVAENMCGWSLKETKGKQLSDFFHVVNAKTGEEVENPVQKVLETGKIVGMANHTMLIAKDGTRYQIADSGSPICNAEGEIIGVVLVFRDVTEEYRIQEALKESKNQLSKAQSIGKLGSWLFNMNSGEIAISDESYSIYGLEKGREYTIEEVQELPLPQYREKLDQRLKKLIKGKQKYKLDFKIARPSDGQIIDIHSEAVYDKEENTVTGIIQDITERKQAEEALRLSEEKFRKLFKNHTAIKLIFEPETERIIEANHAASKFYGWSVKQLVQMKITDINIQSDEAVKQKIALSLKNRNSYYEFQHRKADGSICDVEVFSSLIEIDGKEVLHSIVHDVTEKKKNENRLKLLSRSVEQSPVSIVITNPDGIIEYINPTFSRVSGYSSLEAIGRKPSLLKSGHQTNEVYAHLWQTITAGKEWRGELLNKRKDGDLYWEDVTISPIFDTENQITHYIAVKEDITEKKQIVEELLEAKEQAEESDRLKSAFLANMSHEIRTPMNGILGFADLLKEKYITEDQKKEYVEIIKESGNRMLNTINDLIDISKIESGMVEVEYSEIDVDEQMNYLYTFFKPEAEKKGLKLLYHRDSQNVTSAVITDKLKLIAILTNIVKNAIKYTPKGSIEFGYMLGAKKMEFYVKDTGIGIESDRQEAIFDRFVQADLSISRPFEGAGLGLSISKAYIDMLGGRIWVESAKDKGSVFRFILPHHNETIEKVPLEESIARKTREAENAMKNLSILVAEDDDVAQIYLAAIFENKCKKMFFASNGTEAVEIFRENPDIDLILMDVKMPDMDGYTATLKIKEINNEVKVIAQTAYALSGDREKAISAGCDDYIPKPLNKNMLFEMINKFFVEPDLEN